MRGAAPRRTTATPTTRCSICSSRPRWAHGPCSTTRTSTTTDGLPPEDVEAMRQMLLDMLTDNDELANMDERLAAMIAQIVEAYGRYNSSRGPSYSSYQALKAMNLDDLEGPAAGRPARSVRRRADADAGADRQGACGSDASRSCARWSRARRSGAPPSSWAATTCRCTACRSWPRTSSSCARPASSCARCAGWCNRWPARWPPGWPPVGGGHGPGRSICARRCASRCPPAVCRSTWC